MRYFIYLSNCYVGAVEGDDVYNTWRLAVQLAETLGTCADLVDSNTGEVVESTDFDE